MESESDTNLQSAQTPTWIGLRSESVITVTLASAQTPIRPLTRYLTTCYGTSLLRAMKKQQRQKAYCRLSETWSESTSGPAYNNYYNLSLSVRQFHPFTLRREWLLAYMLFRLSYRPQQLLASTCRFRMPVLTYMSQ